MSEGAIEEIIARCLLNPSFTASLQHNSAEALAPYGLEEGIRQQVESADFDKIQRFSGFISKIQHNYLWESFPATRQLLRYYELELEVFTAYRPHQLSADANHASRDERTRSFLDFLEAHLANGPKVGTSYPGLSEVLQHERAIWDLVSATSKLDDEESSLLIEWTNLSWSAFQRLLPAIHGPMRLCVFDVDPEQVIRQLKEGTFAGIAPNTERSFFAYRINRKTGYSSVLKFDSLSVSILSRIDGKRSVRSVIASARRSGLGEIRPLAFRSFFEEIANMGIIRLDA